MPSLKTATSSKSPSEVDRILSKYLSYSLVVCIFEQTYPQCVLFTQPLPNFFVLDNLTFVLFEPSSCLKWMSNLNNISPYEYYEGDMMHKFIYSCLFQSLLGGISKDHKLFQILDPSDKIEEITEEISDLRKFDQTSRLF